MESALHGLQQFLLSSAQFERVRSHYKHVLGNTQLWQSDALRAAVPRFHRVPAIYFWALTYQGQRYSIYVGKTNSLGYRIQNYAGSFQPHSPNDFKLQVFHTFAQERYAGSELDMYYSPCDASDLTAQESNEISYFSPLLNTRMRASAQARHNLQQAFVAYYQAGFAEALHGS